MNALIERVELYEEPLENGKFLKSITFKFPVVYNNSEAVTLGLDEFNNIETVVLLSRKAD